MKSNRILSTAGISPSEAMKIRSYCSLIQGYLTDKWLFADDFIKSHVCIVSSDYLINLKKDKLKKSQIIIVFNTSYQSFSEFEYQLVPPITSKKVQSVLNQISKKTIFKPLNQLPSEPSNAVNKFKSVFNKLRTNFFGKKASQRIEIQQQRKQDFIQKLTQNIQTDAKPIHKIVFLGSPGSGKTTAIKSISGGKSLSSEVSATDSVAKDKTATTVGIDYAKISLAGNKQVALFGTPGQVKFNYVWDIVGRNANAFVILLDMSRPDPLAYLKFYTNFLCNEIGNTSTLHCAFTHCDKFEGDIDCVITLIKIEFRKIKDIFKIDAREKQDITAMITQVALQLDEHNINVFFSSSSV